VADSVIRAENLGKRYTLGQRPPVDGLRHLLEEALAAPLRVLTKSGRAARANRQPTDRPGPSSVKSDFWALRDVSLEVTRGEVLGIVGRNGAGKSTLLKILSRITEPTAGRIEIDGRVASLLEVGTGFHPELTGRENVFLNGAILGMTRADVRRKFDEIVEFAEISQFLDTPVKRYSSGMYVRLAFAVAAHLEPDILIVDEVLAVGDFEFQKKCLGKMGEVASKRDRTVLFVSHNMNAVRALCSRGLLLEKGRVTATGDSSSIVERFLSVASLQRRVARWDSPETAPGDECARLKSVSVACEGMAAGQVDMQKDFEVSVEYWILQPNSRIFVSFHLLNARDEIVVTGGNMKSISESYDPWIDRSYPIGVFRTTCTYPARLFNDGTYKVTVYINDTSASRHHVVEEGILSFDIIDTGFMREDYHGPWPGILRMKLPWRTECLASDVQTPLAVP